MDWPRAQRILIGAFLLLNAFLTYQLWGQPWEYGGRLLVSTQEQVREIQDQLSRSGIRLKVEIPRRVRPRAFLDVTRVMPDPIELERQFLGRESVKERVDPKTGWLTMVGTRGELVIEPAGVIHYRPTAGQGTPLTREALSASDLSAARSAAEQFIASHGGMPSDARLDGITLDKERKLVVVNYFQDYQGTLFFGSYLTVGLAARRPGEPLQVESYDRLWVEFAGLNRDPKPLLPATSALLRAAGHLESAGYKEAVVTGITLGYYSRPYDADHWVAAPVWRIRLEDGQILLINAITGELES